MTRYPIANGANGKPRWETGKCLCGLEECKEVKKQFRTAFDLRGQVRYAPDISSVSRNVNMKNVATKWIKRTAHHWKHNPNSNSQELDKICNQKEKASKPLATRTRQSVSQVSSKIIAFSKKPKICLWHYHPKIIEYFHKQNCSTIPRTVSVSLMRDLGLYGQGAGAFCTVADTITVGKETLALVLPVYHLSQAKKDSLSSIEDWNNEQVLKKAIMQSSEGIGSSIRRKRSASGNTSGIASSQKRPRNGADNDFLASSTSSEPASQSAREVTPSTNKNLGDGGAPRYLADFKKENEALKRENKKQMVKIEKLSKENLDLKGRLAQIQSVHDSVLTALNNRSAIENRSISSGERDTRVANNLAQLSHDLSAFESKGAGLNRISLTSIEYLARKECRRLCNSLYGFEDFEFLVGMIEAMFDIKYEKPTRLSIERGKALSDVEQVLLTLAWCNTQWNDDIIGLMFGVCSRQTVEVYVNKWLPMLGERGDMMSEFLEFLDEDAINALEPESYKILGLKKIALVIDGKDYDTETIRQDRVLNCNQASNKTHGSAFRNLTWSLPCGAAVERTSSSESTSPSLSLSSSCFSSSVLSVFLGDRFLFLLVRRFFFLTNSR